MRKDVPRDKKADPVFWELYLTPKNPEPEPKSLKTYYVAVTVATTRWDAVGLNGRVKAYFFGDGTDVLQIYSQSKPEYHAEYDGSTNRNSQVFYHTFDTDGYTTMLLASANLPSVEVAPRMRVLLNIGTSSGSSCFSASLPEYIKDLENPANSTLTFTPGGEMPDASKWNPLDGDGLPRVPGGAWGPPASSREQGDQKATYTYYFRPR